MRWFWIDRFTEFICDETATAVKNVSLAEDYLHDHFDGCPVMPNSLVVEGMAQTAGLLVSEIHDFEELVVLAKVACARFEGHAVPGDTLTYTANVVQTHRDGAMASVTSRVGDRPHGSVDLFFAHLDNEADWEGQQRRLFEPEDLLRWLRVLGVFDVGRNQDGTLLEIPPSLLAPETEMARSAARSSTE